MFRTKKGGETDTWKISGAAVLVHSRKVRNIISPHPNGRYWCGQSDICARCL